MMSGVRKKLTVLYFSLFAASVIFILAGTEHFDQFDDEPLIIHDMGWVGFAMFGASCLVMLAIVSITDPEEERKNADSRARLERAVSSSQAMCWHHLNGTLTGVHLVSGGKDVVTLRRKGRLSYGRFIGTTPLTTIELKSSTIWSDLTYRTVIVDADTNEVMGEYVASHGLDGKLDLKGKKYTLTGWMRDAAPEGHYLLDTSGRKLAVTTRDTSSPRHYFEPLDLMPEDPDKWIIALLQMHFIINFHGDA